METINTKEIQAVFVNTNNAPIKTEHVCWYTQPDIDHDKISLIEVVKEFYPHPDAPEDCTIFVLNNHVRQRTNKFNGRAFIRNLEMVQAATSDAATVR